MRLIPGKTKVQVELFKGVRLTDIFIAAGGAGLIILLLISTVPGKIYIALGLLLIAAVLLVRVDSEPNYMYLLHILRFLFFHHGYVRAVTDDELLQGGGTAREADTEAAAMPDGREPVEAKTVPRKKEQKKAAKRAARGGYAMRDIIAFTDIRDGFVEYDGKYYGAVLEIPPVEFRFFSPHRRNNSIENGVGRVLRSLPPEYAANIIKIERTAAYESYLEHEYGKLDVLKHAYESGAITEEEMKSRVEVLYGRINDLRDMCDKNRVVMPFYYLVLFDSDRGQLNIMARNAIDLLHSGELDAHRLNTKELAIFLKSNFCLDFDPHEIDRLSPEQYAAWAMPRSIDFKYRTVVLNDIVTHNMRLTGYPSEVSDAWLASVMSMPATKVNVKCTPVDSIKAIRAIDFSLQELRTQLLATGVDSKRIELQEHIDTLSNLLSMLQGANETLLQVNIYVTCYDIALTRATGSAPELEKSALANISNLKRSVRRLYRENGLRMSNMDFDQVTAFIGSQVSAWDPLKKQGRGIPSNSVAAAYPWIFAHISDQNGIKLGTADGVPVFIDFFCRNSERVNSNMVIVGKSGSGKSYATKSLLANLAADDSKIFVLDPENEYTDLAQNLHGKFINVGNAQFGRLNPFHIITALDDDEDGASSSGSYATHLQFLEEFFRQILPDCDRDAMEYLNSIVDRVYTNMGITADTDLSRLRPEDYPVFDDLYDAILEEFQSTENAYIRTMLRTLMNYIAKFSAGGRNANIWNGPSTVTTEENFTVFNFQSLLANRNGAIANAQMLLVLKYIDNEIIKNRDYNLKYHMNRKIVVAIDEAHVFIDTKYPAALDFMFQLAKRIRKYNGMQIVITQNIKDFVGSEEIARKSTAIINACQYSFIFSLAPNDMDDLCRLYEKAGGINESEQEEIISAPRGQAFTVMSPQSRSTFKVTVPEDVAAMFEEHGYISRYFRDADGEAAWEAFIGDSRDAYKAAHRERLAPAIESRTESDAPKLVTFSEISEEELLSSAVVNPPKRGKKSVSYAEEPEDDFPKIPELPEDPERIACRKPEAPHSAPESSPQSAPVPASGSRTEELLSELLSRFSYESMVEEIRRSVRAEMDKEFAARMPAMPTETAFKPESGEAETRPEPDVREAAIRNAQPPGDAAEGGAEPMPFEAADLADGGFDIMALLSQEAERLGSISPIEMMEAYGEMTASITLEDLILYNRGH